MSCKLCSISAASTPADRRCAFESGVFSSGNWQCGTVLALRLRALMAVSADPGLAPRTHRLAVIGHKGVFLEMVWFGQDPSLDRAKVLRPRDSLVFEEDLSLDLAEKILAWRAA